MLNSLSILFLEVLSTNCIVDRDLLEYYSDVRDGNIRLEMNTLLIKLLLNFILIQVNVSNNMRF